MAHNNAASAMFVANESKEGQKGKRTNPVSGSMVDFADVLITIKSN